MNNTKEDIKELMKNQIEIQKQIIEKLDSIDSVIYDKQKNDILGDVVVGDYISYFDDDKEYLAKIVWGEYTKRYTLDFIAWDDECREFDTIDKLLDWYSKFEWFTIYKTYKSLNDISNFYEILHYASDCRSDTLLSFFVSKKDGEFVMYDEDIEEPICKASTYNELISKNGCYDVIIEPIKEKIVKDEKSNFVVV